MILLTNVMNKFLTVIWFRLERTATRSSFGTGTNKSASHSKVSARVRQWSPFSALSATKITTLWSLVVTIHTSSSEFRKITL